MKSFVKNFSDFFHCTDFRKMLVHILEKKCYERIDENYKLKCTNNLYKKTLVNRIINMKIKNLLSQLQKVVKPKLKQCLRRAT